MRYEWAFWLCVGWTLCFVFTAHYGLVLAAYITLLCVLTLIVCAIAYFRE